MPKPAPTGLDPLELLRDTLNKFESKANAFANSKMASEDFARVMQLLLKGALGGQKLLSGLVTSSLHRLNVPTRSDVKELGERLQRIEDLLEQLPLSLQAMVDAARNGDASQANAPSHRVMPPRTRRPALAAPAVSVSVARSSKATAAESATSRPPSRRPRATASKQGSTASTRRRSKGSAS